MADSGLVLPAPFDTLEQAWLAFRDLVDQMGPLVRADLNEGEDGNGVAIGVDETPVAHGLRLVPRLALHSCPDGVLVEHTRSDENFTYWRASAATTIKIVTIP